MLRSRALVTSTIIACTTCIVACSDDGASETTPGGTTTSTTTGGGGGSGGGGPLEVACDGAPAELSLSGTWAAYGRMAVSLAALPGGAITICPADQIAEATILMLVEIDEAGGVTQASAALCDLELPVVTALVGTCDPAATNLVSTQIIAPQALLDALPQIATEPAVMTLDGTAPGAGIDFERIVVTIGSTKRAAEWPTWNTADQSCNSTTVGRTNVCEETCVDDCLGLRDDDGDGYPGVTAEVCGKTPDDVSDAVACNTENPNDPGSTIQGRASLAIEVDPLLTGTAKSSCELTGNVDSNVLYSIVGADVWLSGSAISVTSAIKSLPTFQVDPVESRFRMIRVDGQYGAPDWGIAGQDVGAACAGINEHVNDF